MLNLKKRYKFVLVIKKEAHEFESDPLAAYELANNYDGDLYLKNVLVFSPLKMSFDKNVKSIEENLGITGEKRTLAGRAFNLGRRHKDDPRVKEYKTLAAAA